MRAKVVHIITKLELGGAQQNTLYTVSHLDRNLFRPYLITGTEGPLVPEAKGMRGVKSYFLPELVREVHPLKDLLALFKIRALLREIKASDELPLIVHTHSSKAGVVGRWAGYLARAEIIIHSIHGFGFNDYQSFPFRRFLIALEKLTGRITHHFIPVSWANLEKGVSLGIFPRAKATMIRSGIDLELFSSCKVDRKAKRRELGLEEGLPVVVMIACLKPQKAPLDFVEVARRVLSRKEANFLLVGDGVLRPKVLEAVKRAGISARFHLLGWRWDVAEILACSDVLVLTSLWEGLPRVIPQAMASGVPVVATAVDGTPEAVVHGVSGFLTRPHEVEEMASRVLYLLENPQVAKRMGREAQGMVEEFDEGEMLRRQQELYLRLLKEAGYG